MDKEKIEFHADQLVGFLAGYQMTSGLEVIEMKLSRFGVIVEVDGIEKQLAHKM